MEKLSWILDDTIEFDYSNPVDDAPFFYVYKDILKFLNSNYNYGSFILLNNDLLVYNRLKRFINIVEKHPEHLEMSKETKDNLLILTFNRTSTNIDLPRELYKRIYR